MQVNIPCFVFFFQLVTLTVGWELISAPDTFKSTYCSLHGASQAVSCSYGKQAFEIPQQPNLNLICEYEPSHDRTRNILVFLKHRFICQEIWGGWHQRSDLIDFNHTPEIGRARGLPSTIIQRARPGLYLGFQPSVCFEASAFWWIGLRLWTYKSSLEFQMWPWTLYANRRNETIVCQRKADQNLTHFGANAFPKKQHAIWIFYYYQMLLSAPWQRWLIICSWLSTQCLTDTHCENVPLAMLDFVPLKDEFFPFASSGSWSFLSSLGVPQ